MINNGHVYEAEEYDKIKDELAAIGVEEVRRRKRMDKKVCSRFFDAKGFLRVVASGQGAYLTIGGEPKLNFCSSHYLGFAEEPRLKKAAQNAIEKYGLGTGYRTLSGTHALHVQLPQALGVRAGPRRAAATEC